MFNGNSGSPSSIICRDLWLVSGAHLYPIGRATNFPEALVAQSAARAFVQLGGCLQDL